MGKIDDAIHEIHRMDAAARKDQWLNQIHSLPKLLATIWFIVCTTSFHKYDVTGTLSMALYLVIVSAMGDVSWKDAWKRIKIILLFVCAVGIANPFFDRTIIGNIGSISVTGGMVSMGTLIMKGVFSVSASYLLIISTTIEDICNALQMLHVPKMIVTMIMLSYRYIMVLLKEAQRISTAYALRAPNQKGIHYKAWGSLLGQMLLRSVDRAQTVYESMTLRGYHTDFYRKSRDPVRKKDIQYLLFWFCFILVLRVFPIFEIAGELTTLFK